MTDPTQPSDSTRFLVFEAGDRLFAVPAGEVAGVTEQTVNAALPHAPPSVLGIVCVRGQMLTALDPPALTGKKAERPTVREVIIALCGDEQLALAAERIDESVLVESLQILCDPASESDATTATAGSFTHRGREVLILDPQRLFAAAIGKSERRRRRSL